MTNQGNEVARMDAVIETTESPIDSKKVVREINRLAKETVERGSMDIGEYVLDEVFQGSLDAVMSRNPYKSRTLHEVCGDPDLVIDRRRLGTWVKAAALRRDLKTNQVDCSKLGYSHFVALLKVTDENKRRELATEANGKQLTVRQVIEMIDAPKPGKASNGKAKELMKKMGNPLALLEDVETKKQLEDAQSLERDLQSTERITLVKLIDQMVEKMLVSTSLLKETKRSLVMIELGSFQTEQA